MHENSKTHTRLAPKVGRLSVTKRKRGLDALTAVEEGNKTRQELHNDIKGFYWVQTINGIKYLSPAKYDSLEKLHKFKVKNPGSYMKNNINNMRQAYDELDEETELDQITRLIKKAEDRKKVNTDYTKL